MSYTTKDYKVGKMNVNEKVKEAELRKEFRSFLDKVGAPVFWCNDEEQTEWMFAAAKHFYGLGLKEQKEWSLKNAIVIEGICLDKDFIDTKHGILAFGAEEGSYRPFNDGDKVKIIITKG